ALEQGLALWRGPALANLRDEPYGRRAADRLDELRLYALETRIDLRLALGAAGELVPELHALAGDHPLRERVRGQLMLALYRAGRQGDALAQFREMRELLVSTLGLEPTPELRRLQEAILRQDEALQIARPPAPASSFLVVGGDERVASLFGPLARARGSELLLVGLV